MKKAVRKKILDDQKQADPEVVRLKKHIDKLEQQLTHHGNPDVDAQVLKLRAEANKLRGALKAAHGELTTERDRNELLLATSEPPRENKWRRKSTSQGKATAIVVLSDWHVEEVIELDKVNYLNEFNLDIAEKRIERTFQKSLYMLDFARRIAKIDEVVVALLGDFITGYIHEELEEGNSLAPLEACRWVQGQIADGLKFLRKHAKANLVVPTAYGNHGRTTKKKRIATAAENSYEFNLYKQLERQFIDDPKIAFKVERGYHNNLEVQKRIVRFHHGDALKFGGGIGGITIPVRKALAQWDNSVRADLDVFGHFHQFNASNYRWLCNGSLIGYSPYAVSIKAEYEPPKQGFIVIDRDYGNILTAPLFCTEAQ